MSSPDLPPPSVFWDIVAGKNRLVDGLKPDKNIFLDVAEAWRWSKKMADQELWLAMAKVDLHLRLSSRLTTASVPVSWTYYGDPSWWEWKDKHARVGGFSRGDEDLRGRVHHFLVFHQYAQNIIDFYEKEDVVPEIAFYAFSRKERKLMPGFVLKHAFITDRTNRASYLSWDFEIVAGEAWRTDKLW